MEAIDWLCSFDDGTVRRTARKRFGRADAAENTCGETGRYWTEKFRSVLERRKLHGSFDHCFENSSFKVRSLFIDADEVRDTECRLVSIAGDGMNNPDRIEYRRFGLNILAGHLLLRGFTGNASIIDFAKKRIDAVYDSIRKYAYDIYIENAKSIPAAFRDKKVVNPELTGESLIPLPLIYDLLYFHVIGRRFPEYREKIGTIIRYVLSDEYQRFPPGFGIGLFHNGWYAIGWSVTISSFFDSGIKSDTLFNLLILSCYRAAIASAWFKKTLVKLKEYEREEGFFEFPPEQVREKKNSYWVGGNHLGIAGNRRLKSRNRAESTYWYYVIKENMKNAVHEGGEGI